MPKHLNNGAHTKHLKHFFYKKIIYFVSYSRCNNFLEIITFPFYILSAKSPYFTINLWVIFDTKYFGKYPSSHEPRFWPQPTDATNFSNIDGVRPACKNAFKMAARVYQPIHVSTYPFDSQMLMTDEELGSVPLYCLDQNVAYAFEVSKAIEGIVDALCFDFWYIKVYRLDWNTYFLLFVYL